MSGDSGQRRAAIMKRSSTLAALICSILLALVMGLGGVLQPMSGSSAEALLQGPESAGHQGHQACLDSSWAAPGRLLALESRTCKPQAPIAVQFDAHPLPGTNGLLKVHLEVEPAIELREVRWSLILPEGVTALGPTEGGADPRMHSVTRQDLLLDVSGTALASGRTRTAGPDKVLSELVLDVQGFLPNSAGSQAIVRRSSLSLNEPQEIEFQVRHFSDADTGSRSRVAALPVAHRKGR